MSSLLSVTGSSALLESSKTHNSQFCKKKNYYYIDDCFPVTSLLHHSSLQQLKHQLEYLLKVVRLTNARKIRVLHRCVCDFSCIIACQRSDIFNASLQLMTSHQSLYYSEFDQILRLPSESPRTDFWYSVHNTHHLLI